MNQPVHLPGDPASWDTAAVQWLQALGCAEPEAREVALLAGGFTPKTLKQVLTAVMDLGRRAGRLGETMALLGHQEARFRQLREEIGIPRAAPPEDLVPSAVLVLAPSGWIAPGGWIPDLLDRAAGRDVLHKSGDAPAPADLSTAVEAGAHHIFLMVSPGLAQDAALRESQAARPSGTVHVVSDASRWLEPGPLLSHAVFDAASRMHGVSAVFS